MNRLSLLGALGPLHLRLYPNGRMRYDDGSSRPLLYLIGPANVYLQCRLSVDDGDYDFPDEEAQCTPGRGWYFDHLDADAESVMIKCELLSGHRRFDARR